MHITLMREVYQHPQLCLILTEMGLEVQKQLQELIEVHLPEVPACTLLNIVHVWSDACS